MVRAGAAFQSAYPGTANHVMLRSDAHVPAGRRCRGIFRGGVHPSTCGISQEESMKLDPRNVACIFSATLLALALSGCGKEPPPTPVAKAVPIPAAPADQAAAKADAERMAAQTARAAADKELAGRVKSALVAERGLNAHGIDVVAKDGAVTLYGTAETRTRREMAEKIASRVDGVKSVDNKLAVVAGS
jgi:hyperosmotically inducible protein